jgi:hypothetical protein
MEVSRGRNSLAGIVILLSFSLSAMFVARLFGDDYSKERQGKARELLGALADKAREILKPEKA